MAQLDPLRLQAVYYVAGGIWPIVHLRSFMALTGRKRDTWLVKSFGLLLTALGAAMLPRRDADRRTQEQFAVAANFALAAADVVFALRGRISPIYLADAAVELALAAAVTGATRSLPAKAPGRRSIRTST